MNDEKPSSTSPQLILLAAVFALCAGIAAVLVVILEAQRVLGL